MRNQDCNKGPKNNLLDSTVEGSNFGGDKVFCVLKLVLPQIVNLDDAVMVAISPELIKS